MNKGVSVRDNKNCLVALIYSLAKTTDGMVCVGQKETHMNDEPRTREVSVMFLNMVRFLLGEMGNQTSYPLQ